MSEFKSYLSNNDNDTVPKLQVQSYVFEDIWIWDINTFYYNYLLLYSNYIDKSPDELDPTYHKLNVGRGASSEVPNIWFIFYISNIFNICIYLLDEYNKYIKNIKSMPNFVEISNSQYETVSQLTKQSDDYLDEYQADILKMNLSELKVVRSLSILNKIIEKLNGLIEKFTYDQIQVIYYYLILFDMTLHSTNPFQILLNIDDYIQFGGAIKRNCYEPFMLNSKYDINALSDWIYNENTIIYLSFSHVREERHVRIAQSIIVSSVINPSKYIHTSIGNIPWNIYHDCSIHQTINRKTAISELDVNIQLNFIKLLYLLKGQSNLLNQLWYYGFETIRTESLNGNIWYNSIHNIANDSNVGVPHGFNFAETNNLIHKCIDLKIFTELKDSEIKRNILNFNPKNDEEMTIELNQQLIETGTFYK